jgi:hypothetical protein
MRTIIDQAGGTVNSYIYDKTEKGREEIATRKYHVAAKLRTLLVLIDGRHSLGELMSKISPLGLDEEAVNELLDQQYIVLVSGGPAANEEEGPGDNAPARLPASAAARARLVARNRAAAAMAAHAKDHTHEAETAQAAEELVHAAVQEDMDSKSQQLQALAAFFNQTIKSTLGLRGLMLQLKAEKAATMEEFAALRLPYLEAVYKAKGRELTISLRDRLDQLMGGKPEIESFIMPD